MKPTSYAPFEGDGRTSVDRPLNARPGSKRLTRAQARRLIDLFWKNGVSTHDEVGSTIWVIEAWAAHQSLKITVEKRRHLGGKVGHHVTLGEPQAIASADAERMAFLDDHWLSMFEGKRLHDWLSETSTLMSHGSLRKAIDYARTPLLGLSS